MRATYREANQRCTDLSISTECGVDSEPRTEPYIVVIAMNSHRADHLFRHARHATHRHQLLRMLIDIVPIVADKNSLLDAEHRTSQPERLFSFPIERGPFDAEFARHVRH